MTANLERPGGPFATMHEAVRHWAALTPDAPALFADGHAALGYRGLLRTVDAIGAQLAALGIARNDRVAVLHPGGADMAAAILGIVSHATAAPLSPSYTVGEFAIYLRDLRVKALTVAADMDTPARIAAERLRLPVIEIAGAPGDIALTGAAAGAAVQACPARPDDIALLLTTSGTTSHSKIVPIRHRQLMARCHNAARRLELRPEDRCLNLMPLYHSHGLNSGLGVSLVAGGSVIAMPRFDVASFFRYIEALEPTWFTAVFTFHHQIHAHAKAHRATIARSPLRFIHTSSGRLEPRIADELESWFGVPMLGTYASTETGVMTGDSHPPALRKRDSVGTPAGPEVAVFGGDGKPAPAGTRGEVRVRGANVFDGYENEAASGALTADGWFCTGDEGLLDGDGFLFLTGRVKETINRGGEKISPSEIDEALLRHPDVVAATAFAIPHATLGEEAAAAVVLRAGASASEKDLAEFLRQRLAAFKVPRRILVVDDIPKGPTGKVQRHALAAAFGLDGGGAAASTPATAAARKPTPMERRLQALWRQTLGVPIVGLDDDFFLLGGDSLQAVELFLAIEETLGRRLPRSVLFEASTVAEMAHRIEAAAPTRCLVPIRATGSRPIFFCVHDLNGQVLNLRSLAASLGPEQPFYGIQAAGLDGTEAPLARIEDMAARYIAEIQSAQPAGPYHIGGYSMGGLVALEMARQLRAAGETVELLALLDTYPRDGRRRFRGSGWLARDGNSLADRKPASLARYVLRGLRVAALAGRTALWRGLFGVAWRVCERSGATMPRWLFHPTAASLLALRRHRMTPYDGDALLFAAERYSWERGDVLESWRGFIGGRLTVHAVPGLHHTFLEEPHVRVVARALSDALDECWRRSAREDLAAAG